MAKAPSPAKTIGILTSGGDCAGLNAAIRAVVARAVQGYGWRVYGIRQGTMGVMRRPVEYEELDLSISTVNMLRLGGTILGTTNKGDPFAFPMPYGSLRDRSEEVIEGIRSLGIEALIGVGGDGSFAILRRLAQQGGMCPHVGHFGSAVDRVPHTDLSAHATATNCSNACEFPPSLRLSVAAIWKMLAS